MATQKSTLILPVENQVRELDAKLLLACVAAERGFSVVLGSRTFIHYRMASIPRGVYLAKSMRRLSERVFGILRDLGHEIVAWDEESLIRFSDRSYYERRLSAKAMSRVSALFAWGPDDERIFRNFPGYSGAPIHITGNPRSDLMRSEIRSYFNPEVNRLRRCHGRTVLVNTNFGQANHFVSSLRPRQGNRQRKDEFNSRLAAHRSLLFIYFQAMVPALSQSFPDHTILVRPHPSEDHGVWKKIAVEHRNVRVVNEGNVIPWLMACEVLIQNGCTTAVEAALLDTPTITYEPVVSDEFDVSLTRDLTHRVGNLSELEETTRAIVDGELGIRDFPERQRRIARHITALDGPLASERMVDSLGRMGYASHWPRRSSPLRFAKGWAHTKIRTWEKTINMRRPGHRNNIVYHDHRFPEVTVDELRERIARLGQQLSRFEQVQIESSSRHIFQLYV